MLGEKGLAIGKQCKTFYAKYMCMLKRWFLGRSVLIYTSAKHYHLIWTKKTSDTPFGRANLRDVTMAVKKCVYVIHPVLTFINLCILLKNTPFNRTRQTFNQFESWGDVPDLRQSNV